MTTAGLCRFQGQSERGRNRNTEAQRTRRTNGGNHGTHGNHELKGIGKVRNCYCKNLGGSLQISMMRARKPRCHRTPQGMERSHFREFRGSIFLPTSLRVLCASVFLSLPSRSSQSQVGLFGCVRHDQSRASGSDSGGGADFGGIILEIATDRSILFAALHFAVVFEQSF
jgi:hypothetical protein